MKLKYISWLPALAIMIIIFMFSSKPVDESHDSSFSIAERILSAYENMTEHPIAVEPRMQRLESINHIVRKGAHFAEYALLAVAVAFHLYVWKRRGKPLLLITILFSSFYAATDEFHQLFVDGRGAQVRDVLLDTAGAIAGVLLFVLLTAKHRKEIKLLIK